MLEVLKALTNCQNYCMAGSHPDFPVVSYELNAILTRAQDVIVKAESGTDSVNRLKDAVWKSWLRGVKSGMGAGTPTEMLKEYGFTGDFAGLIRHYSHPLEIADPLEDALKEISDSEFLIRL